MSCCGFFSAKMWKAATLCVVVVSFLYIALRTFTPPNKHPADFHFKSSSIATMKGAALRRAIIYPTTHNTSWLHKYDNVTELYGYSGSKNASTYFVPTNKGNEAMVYLMYIVDHYHNLPDRNLFLHGHMQSWHQPKNMYRAIENLNWEFDGYFSLRCQTDRGDCVPDVFTNASKTKPPSFNNLFSTVWADLMAPYGYGPLPASVAAPCCAQFFVSKATVLRNNITFYEQARQMPIDSPQEVSWPMGVVFEYLWHIMFTGQINYCPTVEQCHCEAYSVCNKKGTLFA